MRQHSNDREDITLVFAFLSTLFVSVIVMASKDLAEGVVRNNPDLILAPDHGRDYTF